MSEHFTHDPASSPREGPLAALAPKVRFDGQVSEVAAVPPPLLMLPLSREESGVGVMSANNDRRIEHCTSRLKLHFARPRLRTTLNVAVCQVHSLMHYLQKFIVNCA